MQQYSQYVLQQRAYIDQDLAIFLRILEWQSFKRNSFKSQFSLSSVTQIKIQQSFVSMKIYYTNMTHRETTRKSSQQSISPLTVKKESQAYVYDLNLRCKITLDTSNLVEYFQSQYSQFFNQVFVFQNLDALSIKLIRQTLDMHPIIEKQCSNSTLNTKDCFLAFDKYFLLTLSDANEDHNVQQPYSMKMVVYDEFILIFTNGHMFCLDDVFTEHESFGLPILARSTSMQILIEQFPNDNILPTEIKNCNQIESIFHRIVDSIVKHLELLMLKMDEEVNICWQYSNELSYSQKLEFVTRMSIAERHMTFLKDLIFKKHSTFKSLLKSRVLSSYLEKYVVALCSRVHSLQHKLSSSMDILKTSEHIYETSVDDILTKYSYQLNELMKHFSAVATVFLPLNLVAALWGMNVQVPGQDYDNHYSFAIIAGFVILFMLASGVYIQKRN